MLDLKCLALLACTALSHLAVSAVEPTATAPQDDGIPWPCGVCAPTWQVLESDTFLECPNGIDTIRVGSVDMSPGFGLCNLKSTPDGVRCIGTSACTQNLAWVVLFDDQSCRSEIWIEVVGDGEPRQRLTPDVNAQPVHADAACGIGGEGPGTPSEYRLEFYASETSTQLLGFVDFEVQCGPCGGD